MSPVEIVVTGSMIGLVIGLIVMYIAYRLARWSARPSRGSKRRLIAEAIKRSDEVDRDATLERIRRLARVQALHRKYISPGGELICIECNKLHPCPTLQACG